ncbi:MAG: FKBP-type peptidyl-prolyl cis-trans isomerase [Thiolinea sp.]
MPDTIQTDSCIRWRYRLLLANGTLIETHEQADGDLLQLGRGEIHGNLESLLPGLQAGEQTRFLISADQAFGLRDPAAVQEMPLDSFDANQPPQPGQIISFSLPSGQETPGHILAVQAETVTVDFNHPLAGHNLVLEVEIMAILDSKTPA